MSAGKAAKMLPDGEEICQNLGGMKFVGQTVPHGNTGVFGQSFRDLLIKSPVFDTVKHPAQHPGGIGNGLLLAHLGALGIQIDRMHAKIGCCNLECAAGTGAGLLKHQGDGLAFTKPVGDTRLFLCLQLGGKLQQSIGGEMVRRMIKSYEEGLK